MKATKLLISMICIAGLCAWTKKQANGLKQAEWLIGTWASQTARGTMYESWGKVKSGFTGKSYMIKDKDTIIFEQLRLVQEKGRLLYIPTVKSQNGGLPVSFIAKSISPTQLIFENPEHDFPQVISYTRVGADSLVAEISGTKNDQARKQTFPMKRLK